MRGPGEYPMLNANDREPDRLLAKRQLLGCTIVERNGVSWGTNLLRHGRNGWQFSSNCALRPAVPDRPTSPTRP